MPEYDTSMHAATTLARARARIGCVEHCARADSHKVVDARPKSASPEEVDPLDGRAVLSRQVLARQRHVVRPSLVGRMNMRGSCVVSVKLCEFTFHATPNQSFAIMVGTVEKPYALGVCGKSRLSGGVALLRLMCLGCLEPPGVATVGNTARHDR